MRAMRPPVILMALVILAACRQPEPPIDPGVQAVTLARGPEATFTPSPAPVIDTSSCSPEEVSARLAGVPEYDSSDMAFVQLDGKQLALDGERFVVRGLNYYPIEYPFWKFLQVDNATLAWDVELMAEAGINTLRIFVWNDALFTCPNDGAVPIPSQIARLDWVIQTAALRGLYLVVTLHEQPDPARPPLYGDPTSVIAQTAYLVQRYKDEPAILAWDLRNAGDADYQGGVIGGVERQAHVERRDVLDWLIRTAAAVRAIDERHLITAGWHTDAAATFPAVDMVSFQHWREPDDLYERVRTLRDQTDKPLLLIAVGYDSQTRNESQQSAALRRALTIAEETVAWGETAGWLVWTAFDFVPISPCETASCADEDIPHHFGMWHTDRSPKPAINVLDVLTLPLPTPQAEPDGNSPIGS